MCFMCFFVFFFFFKQKTAYEMRISDWSLDVCSSDLHVTVAEASIRKAKGLKADEPVCYACHGPVAEMEEIYQFSPLTMKWCVDCHKETEVIHAEDNEYYDRIRSEEHTSELQSLMRISYAVFCLQKKIRDEKNNEEII